MNQLIDRQSVLLPSYSGLDQFTMKYVHISTVFDAAKNKIISLE